jgi:hypothetical protein
MIRTRNEELWLKTTKACEHMIRTRTGTTNFTKIQVFPCKYDASIDFVLS